MLMLANAIILFNQVPNKCTVGNHTDRVHEIMLHDRDG